MSINKGELCQDSIFDEFYKAHSQSLYSFMYYRTGNADKALDLVQDSFLKIWNKCAEIALEKAKSYLFQTANNLFLNEKRHEKVVLEYQNMYPVTDATHQDPEYKLREKEFQQKLNEVIASLSDGEREVFLLNRIDGKKYVEIAEMLDISVKAVEKRMMKALKKLRAEFDYFKK
ncbi:sigma-70 family RNA polymerase sigma factor [Galbibacter sp. BG1]|uniref:RNA polymerase sigma factor n=1 Tax=Galbibacter sp. BG1 TaxID=1170699 RepID=UPI0015B7CBFB|nr:sigma-70 family RNA polymerase sigma factor [Galbibacter sp. BG1]QLE00408.1 sigma-70 family RNA polymerase sigma factor [Galbibacter sp. BG1]